VGVSPFEVEQRGRSRSDVPDGCHRGSLSLWVRIPFMELVVCVTSVITTPNQTTSPPLGSFQAVGISSCLSPSALLVSSSRCVPEHIFRTVVFNVLIILQTGYSAARNFSYKSEQLTNFFHIQKLVISRLSRNIFLAYFSALSLSTYSSQETLADFRSKILPHSLAVALI
jgi:hypothetical protein